MEVAQKILSLVVKETKKYKIASSFPLKFIRNRMQSIPKKEECTVIKNGWLVLDIVRVTTFATDVLIC